MKKTQAAFIAGFFDGEGCVSVRRGGSTNLIRIIMTQRQPRVLQVIQSWLPFPTYLRRRSRTLTGKGHCWKLSISKAEDIFQFIQIIAPYSIRKKNELAAGAVLAGLIS